VEGLPLAVLGTFRDDDGGPTQTLERLVAWLGRRGRFRRVALGGLAEQETGALLRALAGGGIDAGLIRAVHERTASNPYFVGELWRHLHVAATLGDRRVAERLLPLTAPYAEQWVVVGFGVSVVMSVDTVRGNLLGTLGAWDESAAHFERAIAAYDRERAVITHARALHAYARMLLARGRPADLRKARALVERGEGKQASSPPGASSSTCAALSTAIPPSDRVRSPRGLAPRRTARARG
jgi:hypothetical protein